MVLRREVDTVLMRLLRSDGLRCAAATATFWAAWLRLPPTGLVFIDRRV